MRTSILLRDPYEGGGMELVVESWVGRRGNDDVTLTARGRQLGFGIEDVPKVIALLEAAVKVGRTR